MKKRITLMTIMLLLAINLKAQQNEIIYVDFEPDTVLSVGHQPNDIRIDLDNDGVPDIDMNWYHQSPGEYVELGCCNHNMKMCFVEEGDTISSQEDWRLGTISPQLYEHYGVRLEKEGRYYYGWFRVYAILEERKLCFDKFAFCTVPDYPLRWGQTSIIGVDENETNSIATIHPNPTTGRVTVTGESLQQADVLNILGQRVLGVQGKGEELQLDLSRLPAGIYTLRVTMEDGKTYSDKVVKE